MISGLNLRLRKVRHLVNHVLSQSLASQTRRSQKSAALNSRLDYQDLRPNSPGFVRLPGAHRVVDSPRSHQHLPKPKYTKLKYTKLKYKRILLVGVATVTAGWILLRLGKVLFPDPPTPTPVVNSGSVAAVSGFGYNVRQAPNWVYSETLQTVVDGAVELVNKQGLPTGQLSITLVDLGQPTVHAYAGYNNTLLRYPASVAKLFWLIDFMAAVETGEINDESAFYVDLSNMMRFSDNDSASRIVDAVTGTKSGDPLEGKALETWVSKRSQINKFFQVAGYDGIRLSTKNYPTVDLGATPTGRDFQLWKESAQSGGNQITTDQAARLIYEIYTQQAISPLASKKIAYLLTRNLNPEKWQNDELNSVEGFLSESLPTTVYFGSKIGYTSRSRQEVAFIKTGDGQTAYILTVFGVDPTYAENKQIFPQLSRYIFDQMSGATPISSPASSEIKTQ
ncbi:MAG: serine hydrolase [Oscillatoriales cyanobacterium RM2_1_1]|nr:serine hydrolase [Oscillatoriales cyanobacterium SM2_3_0]NJO45605.1 serine hydrolase [Oscillatoriales cyanobacterium RM2_1_1]